MKHRLAIEVARYNKALDRLDTSNLPEVARISNRFDWYIKFNKLPEELIKALITKFTMILNCTWYGDEPEETIIKSYII